VFVVFFISCVYSVKIINHSAKLCFFPLGGRHVLQSLCSSLSLSNTTSVEQAHPFPIPAAANAGYAGNGMSTLGGDVR